MCCRVALPSAKPYMVYRFSDVDEIEFAVRILRHWQFDDIDLLDPVAVEEAENIVKVHRVMS